MSHYDLIVIGGGSGGLVAAVGAAKLGAKVALIEKNALGGECLWSGCVPSKALIRVARAAHDLRQAAKYGFAPVKAAFAEAGWLSVTAQVRAAIARVEPHDKPEVFEQQGVEIIFGTPRFLTPHKLQVDGRDGTAPRILTAKRFCLAMGSRAAVPDIAGLAATGFVTNEEIFHLPHLPQTLAILGGGAIGLEMAQAFARLGSRVIVLERGGRILPKEDEEISAQVLEIMRGAGLEFRLETEVIAVNKLPDGRKALTVKDIKDTSGAATILPMHEILVATGRRLNVEGLGLEQAGVVYDEQRIVTDDYLRTTARHIFAAGDVTGRLQFTHTAAYEGATVVRNAFMFWPLRQKADYTLVPWATFLDPEVARVGLTEKEAQEKYGAAAVRVYRWATHENDRALAENETAGLVKLVCAGRKETLVGAHIIAPRAGEIVQTLHLAMRQGLSAAAFGGLIFPYPTFTQIAQQAGVEAVLAQFEKPWLKKLLGFYLNFWRGGKTRKL